MYNLLGVMGEKRNGVGSPHRTRIVGARVKCTRSRDTVLCSARESYHARVIGDVVLLSFFKYARCGAVFQIACREGNTTSAFDKNINLRY